MPETYSDPDFTPGMVVAAADRDRDDLRTWLYDGPDKDALDFRALWLPLGTAQAWMRRPDLPERLVVVGDDGRVKP